MNFDTNQYDVWRCPLCENGMKNGRHGSYRQRYCSGKGPNTKWPSHDKHFGFDFDQDEIIDFIYLEFESIYVHIYPKENLVIFCDLDGNELKNMELISYNDVFRYIKNWNLE